jgi:plastocyanin
MLRPGARILALCAVAVSMTGCLLIFEDGGFQSISFHFALDRDIPPGEVLEAEVLVHHVPIALRRNFAQLSGMLMAPEGEELPSQIELIVLTESDTGRRIERVRKTVTVREDGGFKESQRLRRDIPAGATQTITIEPDGVAVPSGTKVWLCLDVVETRGALADLVDCSVASMSPAETVVVEVVDDAFRPPQVQIEPGQRVRWVFAGLDTNHTVTSTDSTLFDSGFIFRSPGDFFELTFGPEFAGQRVDYHCRSHRAFQMIGAVEVGPGV